jgi:hypothetical protein
VTNAYPKIGLEMQLPDWHSEVFDQEKIWTLFAFPLVDRPIASDQYGVTILIRRMLTKDYLRYYPEYNGSEDLQQWMNSRQAKVTQRNNDYSIWTKKDVISADGFAFVCDGVVKRVGYKFQFDKTDRIGGDYRPLALEVNRIIDSIRVIPGRDKVDGSAVRP